MALYTDTVKINKIVNDFKALSSDQARVTRLAELPYFFVQIPCRLSAVTGFKKRWVKKRVIDPDVTTRDMDDEEYTRFSTQIDAYITTYGL